MPACRVQKDESITALTVEKKRHTYSLVIRGYTNDTSAVNLDVAVSDRWQ